MDNVSRGDPQARGNWSIRFTDIRPTPEYIIDDHGKRVVMAITLPIIVLVMISLVASVIFNIIYRCRLRSQQAQHHQRIEYENEPSENTALAPEPQEIGGAEMADSAAHGMQPSAVSEPLSTVNELPPSAKAPLLLKKKPLPSEKGLLHSLNEPPPSQKEPLPSLSKVDTRNEARSSCSIPMQIMTHSPPSGGRDNT